MKLLQTQMKTIIFNLFFNPLHQIISKYLLQALVTLKYVNVHFKIFYQLFYR